MEKIFDLIADLQSFQPGFPAGLTTAQYEEIAKQKAAAVKAMEAEAKRQAIIHEKAEELRASLVADAERQAIFHEMGREIRES